MSRRCAYSSTSSRRRRPALQAGSLLLEALEILVVHNEVSRELPHCRGRLVGNTLPTPTNLFVPLCKCHRHLLRLVFSLVQASPIVRDQCHGCHRPVIRSYQASPSSAETKNA